jgi:hypothetical protein
MKTSEQTDKIIPAYIAASHSVGAVKKSATNPHFRSKYADLETVMDACSDTLKAHNLAIWQSVNDDHMVTRLYHVSGQWMEGYTPLILAKNDMQGLGSAYTYARRYGLMAIMGIAPEDDDGNAATEAKKAEPKTQDAPQHVEAAKALIASSRKVTDNFDKWLKENAGKISEIKTASSMTYDYLMQRLNERRQEMENTNG